MMHKFGKVVQWKTTASVQLQLLTLLLLNVLAATRGELSSLKVVYAVNAGGPDHTDRHGIHYESDPLVRTGIASDYGNNLLMIGRVPEQDEVLYRTERYHTSSFGYEFPIDGDGDYVLVMKFCEVYFNAPRMKVFDVVLNKEHTIVSQLDIFQEVGHGIAHDEIITFKVAAGSLFWNDEVSYVHNGQLRLEFIKGLFDNPKINAFALLKGDITQVPHLPPISADDSVNLDGDVAAVGNREGATRRQRQQQQQSQQQRQQQAKNEANIIDDDDDEDELDDLIDESHNQHQQQQQQHQTDDSNLSRKTSGPRQPNPYTMDDSSVLMPVFIAIGAFIPLLFCLCKL